MNYRSDIEIAQSCAMRRITEIAENAVTSLIERVKTRFPRAYAVTVFVSDALSAPDGPAPTYLDMFRHNVTLMTQAMAGEPQQ